MWRRYISGKETGGTGGTFDKSRQKWK
jgi:hypothetical protein